MALNTNGITFSGLASGLDSSKLIQALVALESQPIQQMQAQKDAFQQKLTEVGTFKGLVLDLQEKARTLSNRSSFLSYTTAVSLAGHVAASASGSAVPGTHTVTVQQLARIDRWTFDPVADRTADLATADGQHIAFSVGGTAYDVPLTAANSSLDDIAAAINSAAGADVAASVVNVGSAGAPSFQLVLASRHSGEAQRITGIVDTVAGLTIDATGPDANGVAQSANNITVGMDAHAVIDGLSVTRETNEFNDVVEGLSITVQAADPATELTISVDADTDAVKTRIQDFVDSFNKLVDYVNKQNSYTKDQGPGGVLFGDTILRRVVSQVRDALFNVDPNVVQGDTEGYSTLSLVGIKTDNDGKLSIDDAVFDDKIAANLDSFADLFIDSDGFDNGGAAPNTPGYYTDTTPDSGLADRLSRAIDRLMDTYTGPGGQVFKGLFDTRTDSYNQSISRLSKDIDDKQAQVDRYQEQLVQRFANLESLMGGLQSQGAALTSALSNLNQQG